MASQRHAHCYVFAHSDWLFSDKSVSGDLKNASDWPIVSCRGMTGGDSTALAQGEKTFSPPFAPSNDFAAILDPALNSDTRLLHPSEPRGGEGQRDERGGGGDATSCSLNRVFAEL